jgi:hypothetical protein
MQKHPKGTMTKKNTAKFEISVYVYGNDNENLNLTKLSHSLLLKLQHQILRKTEFRFEMFKDANLF